MAKEKKVISESAVTVTGNLVTVEILHETFVVIPGGGHRKVKPGDKAEVARDEAEHLVMVGKARVLAN